MDINWLRVCRDVLIIWLISFYNGYLITMGSGVVDMSSDGGQLVFSAVALSNLSVFLFYSVFVSVFDNASFKHLFVVTVLVTLTSGVFNTSYGYSITEVFIAGGFCVVLGGVGKMVGVLINKIVGKFHRT
jgi:hypothetical protein